MEDPISEAGAVTSLKANEYEPKYRLIEKCHDHINNPMVLQ